MKIILSNQSSTDRSFASPAPLSTRAPGCQLRGRNHSLARRLGRFMLWLLVLSSFLFAIYLFRSPLCQTAANYWIVSDPLQKADAIIIFGGGLETRPFAAAKLYRKGYSKQILVAQSKASPTEELGLTSRDFEIARQVLIKEGVPDSAIFTLGKDVRSTYEESCALRDWVEQSGAKSVIIPTDVFHTRRVRWLLRKQLKPVGAYVTVQAVPVREYTQSDWWQHEKGILAFQNELLKYCYYRFKY